MAQAKYNYQEPPTLQPRQQRLHIPPPVSRLKVMLKLTRTPLLELPQAYILAQKKNPRLQTLPTPA
jgi:hypothetical protein